MNHTKHAVARTNQRGFAHAEVKLIFAHGTDQGDRVFLTKKAAIARLTEARAEKATLTAALDTGCKNLFDVMQQLSEVEVELRVLMKLIDKNGGVLVMVGANLITVYGLHCKLPKKKVLQ